MTLVVTALPLLIIPPTLLVTATRAAIHGHCCQVHRIWFFIVHSADGPLLLMMMIHGQCCQVHKICMIVHQATFCTVALSSLMVLHFQGNMTKQVPPSSPPCCSVFKQLDHHHHDEPTPARSPPGEVQAISGGASPGLPCHLGLPRHHHWQRPAKVILYRDNLIQGNFLGVHKIWRCMDVFEDFQDVLVQARFEDGRIWDWTASCGRTSTGNNNLSLTLTFKYNVKCFDISSLHLCFWKVSVLWEFLYICKILCINQGVGPVGIGKRSSATNTLFPLPSCRYLLNHFY